MAEDVVERRPRPEPRLQLGGSALGADATVMHQGDALTERVRLLHVVSGEQHGHAGLLAELPDPLPDVPACERVEPEREVEEAGKEPDILVPGELEVGGELLGQISDQVPDQHRRGAGVVPEDTDRAGVGADQGGQHPDGGRLAGSVGAEQAEDLAGSDAERDPVDRLHGAEADAQVRAGDGQLPLIRWRSRRAHSP